MPRLAPEISEQSIPFPRPKVPVAVLCLLALTWLTACGPSEEELARRMESVNAELATTLQAGEMPAATKQALEDDRAWGAVRKFYDRPGAETVWVDGEGPKERVDSLIEALQGDEAEDAAADAEAAGDGYGAQLAALRDRAAAAVEEEEADMGRSLAALEAAASYAFLSRAFLATEGRVDPSRLNVDWYVEGREARPLELLAQVREGASPAEVLAQQKPQQEDYRRLQEARDRYRDLVAAGGWPQIPAEGEALEEGASGPRVAALRERLAAEGDLATGGTADGDEGGDAADGDRRTGAGGGSATFDAALTQAVQRFQERHGMEADGVVGADTLAALNVPAEERLRTIDLNLERWHWMPAELGEHYVLVNIPEYRLYVMRDGEPQLTMNVIVGKRMNQTPVFSDTMTHLVLNPAWNVPESIATSEVVPKIVSNPGYAASQGIEVVGPNGERMPASAVIGRVSRSEPAVGGGEVDEEAAEPEESPRERRGLFARLFGGRDDDRDDGGGRNGAGRGAPEETTRVVTTLPAGYRIRQAPGPQNPLGQVKFMFPNEHNIYLHDTPTDHLFTSAERGFSHGCIRLERPLELAEYLLQDDAEWNGEKIRQSVGGSQEITVHLPHDMPVHLTYFTARVEDDGRVHFHDDLYGHDQRLAEALAAREPETVDLAALRSAAPPANAG